MSLKSLWRKIAFAGVLGQRVTYSTMVSQAVSKSLRMRKQKLMKQETRSQTLKSRSEVSLLQSLPEEVLLKLIADHWRELQGINRELKRRKELKKKVVPNPDEPTLGA
jgi:hypothetical protein